MPIYSFEVHFKPHLLSETSVAHFCDPSFQHLTADGNMCLVWVVPGGTSRDREIEWRLNSAQQLFPDIKFLEDKSGVARGPAKGNVNGRHMINASD